jgi:hypothetical protein
LEITSKITKGKEYTIPGFGVRNPGTEKVRYKLSAQSIADQAELTVPNGWFTYSEDEFVVGPGAVRKVDVRLKVPGEARPEAYKALLSAEMVTESNGTTAVGAAAAAPVTFQVAATSSFEQWRIKAGDFMRDNAPLSYAVPETILGLGVLFYVRRNFSVNVGRKHS